MNKLEVVANQFSTTCLEAWGENFDAPNIGKLIADNERVSKRLASRICDIAGFDETHALSAHDEKTIFVYCNMMPQLTKLCGLICQGEVIKHTIMKLDFDLVSSEFKPQEMKFAVLQTDLHQKVADYNIDMNNFVKLIEYFGQDCVGMWLKQLDEQTFLKLKLFTRDLPKLSNAGNLVDHDQAKKIVSRVCDFLLESSEVSGA